MKPCVSMLAILSRLLSLMILLGVTAGMDYSAVPPADLGAIARNPEPFIGVGVSVSGIVQATLGKHLIQLEQIRGEARGVNAPVSVIVGDNTGIPPGASLHVIGRVYELSADEVEELTGFLLNAEAHTLLRNEPPVIIAYRVRSS